MLSLFECHVLLCSISVTSARKIQSSTIDDSQNSEALPTEGNSTPVRRSKRQSILQSNKDKSKADEENGSEGQSPRLEGSTQSPDMPLQKRVRGRPIKYQAISMTSEEEIDSEQDVR